MSLPWKFGILLTSVWWEGLKWGLWNNFYCKGSALREPLFSCVWSGSLCLLVCGNKLKQRRCSDVIAAPLAPKCATRQIGLHLAKFSVIWAHPVLTIGFCDFYQ